MKQMGAPHGIRHGKAVHSFEFVERIRDENDAGAGAKALALKYSIPVNTVKDWIYFRARTRA